MTISSTFASALKQRRKALDLTQQELARQVGCAVVTIQRIEQGTLRPSRQIAQRLADSLKIDADERELFVRLGRIGSQADTLESNPQANQPTGTFVRAPLPVPLTPLIGREHERSALRETFADGTVRLITLTGPGGIGKRSITAKPRVARALVHRT
jgi:transcriptional regulator with XRE-family HTH domain